MPQQSCSLPTYVGSNVSPATEKLVQFDYELKHMNVDVKAPEGTSSFVGLVLCSMDGKGVLRVEAWGQQTSCPFTF